MLRLFCFLIAEVASDDRIASGEVAPPEGRLDCSDDQCLQFYKLGADTGQPVIFLHGLLDGIAGVQRLQSQFRKRGFRVYAPLRCGYGQSGPVPSSDRSIDVFIDQLETLIVRENLQRPIILGHRGGAAFAHIAARRLRDRVAGAVIVSGMGPVQKGRSRRLRPVLQPGNSLMLHWRARLEDHLGSYTVE
ncbi:MAG: alpha/beta hydrolase, partial [Rhodobacteraceae bacterium]